MQINSNEINTNKCAPVFGVTSTHLSDVYNEHQSLSLPRRCLAGLCRTLSGSDNWDPTPELQRTFCKLVRVHCVHVQIDLN